LGSGGIAPRILDVGIVWGEWSASRPGRFTPKERVPVHIVYEAGWAPESVGTRWWREKFRAPAGTRIPDHPTRSL